MSHILLASTATRKIALFSLKNKMIKIVSATIVICVTKLI